MRKPFMVVLTGGLLAFLLIAGLRLGGSLEFLELSAYDWFMRLAPKVAGENPRITVIEVTEQDIQTIGHWPLTDETVTAALKLILKGQPRAIGLDIYRDIPVPPGTAELNRVFIDNPHIVGVMTIGDHGIAPLPAIRDTGQAAFGDIVVDPGGIVRRGLLFLDDGQKVYTSFALSLAALYLAAEGITLQPDPVEPQFVQLGRITIRPFEGDDGGYRRADSRGYQFLLDFAEAATRFRSYSLSDLLSGKVPAEALVDRIILVGVRAQSVKDFFYTPLSRGLSEDQQVAGIVLQGHIAAQLLRCALDGTPPVKAPTELQKWLWLLLWCVMGSAIGYRTRTLRRFTLLVAGGLLLVFCTAWLAYISRWWIPAVPPAIAFIMATGGVTAYVTGRERRERAALMQLFSKHVSKEVAGMIWEQRDQFLDNGRPRSQNMTATVLFSDLKGFTAVSEKLLPQELIEWLNTYMEAMAEVIMRFGGVVDSFAGDGIKADFGVPIPRKKDDEVRNDAINAVDCALAMEREMYRLNALWSAKGLPAMGVRIGICTGPVVGGLLGSSERLKYTTIGDTVNVAARLESFDKETGNDILCRILISDATVNRLGGRYATEQVGEVNLKGKERAIMVHRLLGLAASGSPTNSAEVTQ